MRRARVNRPWGWYKTVASGTDWKVKILCVKNGEATSLQSHRYRSETWTPVQGVGIAEVGERIGIVSPYIDGSIFVPKGCRHRIYGSKKGVVIIEVQQGHCLESDIKRHKDKYGRA